jgi:hypothetical protein
MMLRWVTASAVLVSGLVHGWLWWFDGFAEIDVIGPLFLLNAAAGVVIAGATVAWRHWLPLLASVGFGAATLGAFVVSATVGLFGVQERWSGAPVWIAAVSEAVAVLAGGLALVSESRAARESRSGVELEQRTS